MLNMTCLLVDHEDQPTVTISRLTALRVSPDQILNNLIYVQPEERWSKKAEEQLEDSLAEKTPVFAGV